MEKLPIKELAFENLVSLLDIIPVAVTITDKKGKMLFYNDYAAKIADRKPAYLGKDIRDCHALTKSVEKVDQIFEDILSGKKETAYYEAERNGVRIAVTVQAYKPGGECIGFVQSFVVISKP